MSEQATGLPHDGPSAGRLLREARMAAGLDAATLAGQLKVPLAKIEALEADRYDDLPGTAFIRGLAHSMTRALKIDPQPVLARLPQATGQVLEEVSRGLNAPFRARPVMMAGIDLSMLRSPVVWGPLAFVAAGMALWLMPLAPIGRGAGELLQVGPSSTTASGSPATPVAVEAPPVFGGSPAAASPGAAGGSSNPSAASATTAGAAPTSGAMPAPSVEIVHSAPMALPTSTNDAAADGLRPLQLRAGAASWVEVRDARGSLLLSRTLQPGETISLGGALPLKAVVGNAADTVAIVHGRDFNIAQFTANNVARFEVR
jgi:cytoskeleton protein RodZ